MAVGELYKRLIIETPLEYHSYYEKVKNALEEAKADFPETEPVPDWWTSKFTDWFDRWFGNV